MGENAAGTDDIKMRQAIKKKFRESHLDKTGSATKAHQRGPSDSQNITQSG